MKSGIEDFALFGGAPVFATTLLVGRPNVGRRDRLFDRLNDLLDRRWLSNDGPYVRVFCPPPPKGIFQLYSPAASRTGS